MVIVYGDRATVEVSPDVEFPTKESYRQQMNRVTRPFGDPNHEAALNQAMLTFQRSSRPEAKKVVVVITDKFPMNVPDAVKKAARGLELDDVKVIPVPVGSDADEDGIKKLSPFKDVLVKAGKNDNPKELARKIMIKVLKGQISFDFICNVLHLCQML